MAIERFAPSSTSGSTTAMGVPDLNLGLNPSLTGDTQNAPGATSSPTSSSEASVLSSEQGVNDIQKNNSAITSMSPAAKTQPPVATPSGTQYTGSGQPKYPVGSVIDQGNGPQTVVGTNADGSPVLQSGNGSNPTSASSTQYNGKITFLNPDTDQQQEVDANQITPAMLQSLQGQGYYSVSSTGSVPSWFTTGNMQQADAESAAKDAQSKVTALQSQLTTMQQNSDALLASQIENIKQSYQSRIDSMTTENAQRLQAVNTTGYRLGMQYSGGTGGPFGGVISSEEAAGVQRIAGLQSDMQNLILSAQQAAQTNDWKVYDEQVSAAQTSYSKLQDELDTLNTSVNAQNQKLQDTITQAGIDDGVASLMKSGTTDPTEILSALQKQGITATADDVAGALKNLQPTDAGNISTVAQDAAKNGAPQSVIDAISKAANTDAAISAAGGYLQEGTGDVADYLQYKRDAQQAGQVPESFDTYQTNAQEKANSLDIQKATQEAYATAAAKVQADAASGTLTTNDQTVISGADTNLNKGTVGTQMQQVAEQYSVISSIPASTTDPTQQNQLLLALAQMEVPGAKTVRGVLSVNTPDSLDSGVYLLLKNAQSTIDNKGKLSPDVIKSIQAAAKGIYSDQSEAYNNLYNETVQTTNSRLGISNADEYITNLSSIGGGSTSDSMIQNEQQAQTSVVQYAQQNPGSQANIETLLGTNNPSTGQPYTYSDVAQILGLADNSSQ